MKKLTKQFKKNISALTSPFVIGLLVTSLITYAALDFYKKRSLITKVDRTLNARIQELHEKSIDWRLIDRGPTPGSDRVAILAIDDRSIEQEGRWPWPRDKMAKLVEKTLEYGAKIIAFDIVFSEEDSNSSIPTLNRIQRQLKTKGEISPDVKLLLDEELQRANSDRVFAETITKYSDRLVLGTYYDTAAPRSPYSDICVDALFERDYEKQYWSKDKLQPTVFDDTRKSGNGERFIKQHLGDFFTMLEGNRAVGWFQGRSDLTRRLAATLWDLNIEIPEEAYPGISTLWLNNNVEVATQLLEQLESPLAQEAGGAQLVLNRFGSAFTRQESVELTGELRRVTEMYCQKFLSKEDPLRDVENFKEFLSKIGIADEEGQSQFAEYSWTKIWPQVQKIDKALAETSFEDFAANYARSSLPNVIQEVARWWLNIPLFMSGTTYTGYFNAVQDTDGSIRRSQLLARKGNSYQLSLSMKSFLLDKGYGAMATVDVENGDREDAIRKVSRSLEVTNADGKTVMKVPVDGHGRVMINYAGGRGMFPYAIAGDILNDSDEMMIETSKLNPTTGLRDVVFEKVNKREFLKDKILIAGATAIGVYDLRVTPFEENYPGVETHANVLSNLLVEEARLRGDPEAKTAPGFLRTHPDEEKFMWPVLIALGLALSGLLTYFGPFAGLGITAAALFGIYVIDKFVLFNSGIVVTVVFPVALITTNFVSLSFYKYFTEERKKRELKGTFEKYVSPAIVAEVLADPENIELGGRKVDLTVMFSDVRGFTTISEKLDPRELSNLLNSYLTPMTDLVFKHKGTLDKYMGDAIMAFWGAPIHFKDHANHAARCALHMLVKLRELQDDYRAKGLPPIDIGIGLNTGEMSVGNMGSDTVRSYTVMGDAVNLGSRLEGINKEYGTRIIISEFTQKALDKAFATREIDWVKVKGKTQPVRIFELVAEGELPEATRKLLQLFTEGFEHYHERRFEEAIAKFKEALAVKNDDAVSQLYLKRCEEYLAEPPPENWDGVFTMKTK